MQVESDLQVPGTKGYLFMGSLIYIIRCLASIAASESNFKFEMSDDAFSFVGAAKSIVITVATREGFHSEVATIVMKRLGLMSSVFAETCVDKSNYSEEQQSKADLKD